MNQEQPEVPEEVMKFINDEAEKAYQASTYQKPLGKVMWHQASEAIGKAMYHKMKEEVLDHGILAAGRQIILEESRKYATALQHIATEQNSKILSLKEEITRLKHYASEGDQSFSDQWKKFTEEIAEYRKALKNIEDTFLEDSWGKSFLHDAALQSVENALAKYPSPSPSKL